MAVDGRPGCLSWTATVPDVVQQSDVGGSMERYKWLAWLVVIVGLWLFAYFALDIIFI